MARSRNPLLALGLGPGLGLVMLVGACTPNPSPQPIPFETSLPSPTGASEQSTTMPSATAASAIACGPLSPEFCTLAVAVAEGAIPEPQASVLAVSIELPSTLMQCPSPSGSFHGPCEVIATVATALNEVRVFLAWSRDGWTVKSIKARCFVPCVPSSDITRP